MRAFVFPGQGTQFVGMGRDVAQAFPEARAVLDEADEVLGEPLSRVMAEGPAERLIQTEVTQPAVLAHSLALLAVLEARGLRPDVVAGYSLGEYAALVAAGCLGAREAIGLVRDRAQAMLDAHPKDTRSMAVILGPPREEVEAMLAECPAEEMTVVAGYCTPSLHSVATSPGGLQWLLAEGERRRAHVRPVPVTLPFHSEKLATAKEPFRARLARLPLAPPRCPVIPNVSALPERDPERLRELLVEQLVKPVRWVETLAAFKELGVTEVWEIGPGRSLSTYLRKTDRSIARVTINDPASLEAAVQKAAEAQ